jgi:hypothetical protein
MTTKNGAAAAFPVRLTMRMSDDLIRAIALEANKRHATLSDYVRSLLHAGLAAHGVVVRQDGHAIEAVADGGEAR